jgi:hypothetical protein
MRAVHLARAQDDALVAQVGALLRELLASHSVAELLDRRTGPAAISGAMTQLCSIGRSRHLPIEQILVALKQAWATLPEVRAQFGERHAEVLSMVVSACIEQYFVDSERRRRE